jgi:hypothetical protein
MTEPKLINAGSSGEWGWHATELAMRCPQLFAYHHRIKGAGIGGDRDPLMKGSLVHQGLAHYYARVKNMNDDLDPELWATPDRAIEACAEELGTASFKFIDLAKATVKNYASHYATETLAPMHIEEVFSGEVGGFKFTQRFDLVARNSAGKVVIVDHKTTGRLSPDSARRYTLSGQFLGMQTFGRAIWGTDFGGVTINLIELPKWGGEFKFSRVEADPAPNALRGFPLTVLTARQRIADLDAAGTNPWNWPKALSEQTCVTPYGFCDGFDLCRWGKD